MLRGCQRRVIHLRDTKSPLFDEAYFIICEKLEVEHQPSEKDIIKEAKRILGQNLPEQERARLLRRKITVLLFVSFALGMVASFCLVSLFALL